MPSSTQLIITNIVTEIIKTNPQSILDIGIGYGKWGFLCREYLESWRDRVFPNQWQIKIDGIEIFKDYIDYLPWIKQIYDEVYIGDASEIDFPSYDLIIACDIIEHLPKTKGIELIKKCIQKSKCFIASIPIGKNWFNNVIVAGNKNEKHQAIWEIKDLEEINSNFKIIKWQGVKGIGIVAIWKNNE